MNKAAKSASKLLRKITPRTITDRIGINLLELPRPVKAQTLYDLFGHVVGMQTGQTDKGPWVKFKGRFRAVTPDGEVFESGAAHIPVLEDMIHSELTQAKETDPRASLGLAVRVSIVPAPAGKPSATGYEFDVQRLIPPKADATDPLALLQAEAADHARLLEAPRDDVSGDNVAPAPKNKAATKAA